MKNPKEFNGYKVGDTVTCVKEFENSLEEAEIKVGLEGEITDFIPSPIYEWIAQVTFIVEENRTESYGICWNIPATPEYLVKNPTPDESKNIEETLTQTRKLLWNILTE